MAEAENWRLALIIDDRDALKVAVAYYSMPASKRGDLAAIAATSGISQGVHEAMDRLRAAGALGHREPPDALVAVFNAFCLGVVKRGKG